MPGMDRFLALAGPGMFGAFWWPLILTYILTFLVCGIPFGKIFARSVSYTHLTLPTNSLV